MQCPPGGFRSPVSAGNYRKNSVAKMIIFVAIHIGVKTFLNNSRRPKLKLKLTMIHHASYDDFLINVKRTKVNQKLHNNKKMNLSKSKNKNNKITGL